MKRARSAAPLALLLIALAAPARAQAEPQWEREDFTFRLMLGSFDGNENARLLHDDAHRYAVGLSASSPIGWQERLEANMEIWAIDRGYPATTTAAGQTTGGLTFESLSLDYGLRVHTLGVFRPYALGTVGFQANRLEGALVATPTQSVREENLVPAAQVGFGLEWKAGHDRFSLDWRHRFAWGDFSDFGARGLDLGGNFLGIGLGHQW